MTTRSEDGKKETDESFQDIWTRNGSRERCNEHPYFEDLNGSGKIPKPISLIRQKFPRLRAKREREREREELWTSANPALEGVECTAKRTNRDALCFPPRNRAFLFIRERFLWFEEYLPSFFFHSLFLLFFISSLNDEISIERIAHV